MDINKFKNLKLTSEDVSTINTYVESTKQDLIARAFAMSRTLDYVTPMLDVANISTLNILTVDPILQTDSCTWNDSGSIAFTNRNMQVYPKKTNNSVCVEQLKKTWMASKMRPGSHNQDIPFAQFIADTIVASVSEKIEKNFWNGASSPIGIFPLISAASASIGTVNADSTGSFTLSTIDDRVNALITQYYSNSVEAATKESVIYMNNADLALLKQNYQTQNLFMGVTGDANSIVIPMFEHIKAVGFLGIPSGKMFIANPTNVFYGADLVSDETTVEAWYERKDDAVLMRTKFKLGAQVAFLSQITANFYGGLSGTNVI